jgi:two-component system sensor histidine kinase RegB
MSAPIDDTAVLPAAPTEARGRAVTSRINLTWLLWLRWGAAAGQLAIIAFASLWLGVDVALAPLLTLVGIGIASNAACGWWLRNADEVPEGAIAALMALDVLILTGLFYFSGGASNPFSSIYLVNLALAAVVLRPLWTWALVVLSMACFAALFLVPFGGGAHAGHAMGGSGDQLRMHLEGMWVAFALGASFIVYFVHRVARALAEREHELQTAREATARAERLASLATLAAGAAHELATPLSVIAVVTRELERSLAKAQIDDGARSDVGLIREQVERCREILLQLAADAGASTGEDFAAVGIERLVETALRGLDGAPVDVALPEHAGPELVIPVRAVGQAVRALVKNAIEASSGAGEVRVVARLDGTRWRIEVRDRGHGMSGDILERAAEPFFTTKAPGKGMGLGLFLARDVIERVGGTLAIRSEAGVGTTAVVHLPAGAQARPERPATARSAA